MNPVEIEKIRQQLLQLKSGLKQEEKTFQQTSAPVELDQARVGRLSRMDAMQTQQIALETARRHQHQLRQIDAALQRIKSNKYGYCVECEEEINVRRLFINPTSTRCIECAEK